MCGYTHVWYFCRDVHTGHGYAGLVLINELCDEYPDCARVELDESKVLSYECYACRLAEIKKRKGLEGGADGSDEGEGLQGDGTDLFQLEVAGDLGDGVGEEEGGQAPSCIGRP